MLVQPFKSSWNQFRLEYLNGIIVGRRYIVEDQLNGHIGGISNDVEGVVSGSGRVIDCAWYSVVERHASIWRTTDNW